MTSFDGKISILPFDTRLPFVSINQITSPRINDIQTTKATDTDPRRLLEDNKLEVGIQRFQQLISRVSVDSCGNLRKTIRSR